MSSFSEEPQSEEPIIEKKIPASSSRGTFFDRCRNIFGRGGSGKWQKIESDQPSAAMRFDLSFFTIRVKMLIILTSIIVMALSSIIFIISYFFAIDTRARIQKNNIDLAALTASRTQLKLEHLMYQGRHLMSRGLAPGRAEVEAHASREIILVAHFVRKGASLALDGAVYNDRFLNEHNLKTGQIENIFVRNGKKFLPSLEGKVVVANLSAGSTIPLLGLSFKEKTSEAATIILLDPVDFRKTFSSHRIRRVYLVDDKGFPIAHPDGTVMLSGKSLSSRPIVRQMLDSSAKQLTVRLKDARGEYYLSSFLKMERFGLGIISEVEEATAFASLKKMQLRNAWVLFIILSVALLIVYFFAQTISRPIIALVQASRRVEMGDFEIMPQPGSRDEIGLLTNSFMKMSEGLKEKENIKQAMIKLISTDIAEKALKGEVRLGGERKISTIFFCDLRNFTEISDNMEPEQVVELLNTYFTDLVNWVTLTGGIVDKFIGDAMLAYWGALEESDAMDVESAINSALLIRWSLREMNLKHEGEWPFLRFGCGINTGPVIAGQIGSEARMQYTLVGDAVNVASRVEALNKPLGTDILITEETYNYVRDIYRVVEMPPVRVKGKQKAVITYTVLGRYDDPKSPKTLNELKSRIFGILIEDDEHKESDSEELAVSVMSNEQ